MTSNTPEKLPAPTKGGDRKNPQAQLTAKQRQAKVLELRIGGATFAQIAETLNLKGGASYACQLYKKALAAIPSESTAEKRELELLRLDELELRLRARLRNGDTSVVSELRRISDQRAKLSGLYQTTETSNDIVAAREVFGMLAASAAAFAQAYETPAEPQELVVVPEAA